MLAVSFCVYGVGVVTKEGVTPRARTYRTSDQPQVTNTGHDTRMFIFLMICVHNIYHKLCDDVDTNVLFFFVSISMLMVLVLAVVVVVPVSVCRFPCLQALGVTVENITRYVFSYTITFRIFFPPSFWTSRGDSGLHFSLPPLHVPPPPVLAFVLFLSRRGSAFPLLVDFQRFLG